MKKNLLVTAVLCAGLALLLCSCPNNAAGGGNNPEPPKIVTVRFNANGGSGGLSEAIQVTYGQPMPAINAQKPQKTVSGETWHFTGYWDKDTGGRMFYGPDMQSACPWDTETDATLYAQYSTETEPVFDVAYYDKESAFNITTVSQLFQIAALTTIKKDFSGKTITLTNDIDFGSADAKPNFNGIANSKKRSGILFNGTFNGNDKTITNMRIDHSGKADWVCGFFGYVGETGKITSLTLTGGSVKNLHANTRAALGGFVGLNEGTIEKCTNKSLAVIGYFEVGGIVGYNRGTVTNGKNSGTISGKEGVGGIVGGNEVNVEGCANSGSIQGTGWGVGGIAGHNRGTVTNGTNTGTISGREGVGGIAGGNELNVEGCTNSGPIQGTFWGVGGIVGSNNQGTVTNCTNEATGTVRGPSATGGICGSIGTDTGMTGTVVDCTNKAPITGLTNQTGGYIGGIAGHNRGTVTKGTNIGIISGYQNIGGITGFTDTGGLKVTRCANSGDVTGAKTVGGITGRNFGSIEESYNSGTISGGHAEKDRIGGIAGRNGDTSSTGKNFQGFIKNCYNTGGVKGDTRIGGIAGGNEFGNITNCYNIGTVSAGSRIGGIAGDVNTQLAQITGCYYLGTSVTDTGDQPGSPIGTDDFQLTTNPSIFSDWNQSVTVWEQGNSLPGVNGVTSRPVLKNNAETAVANASQ